MFGPPGGCPGPDWGGLPCHGRLIRPQTGTLQQSGIRRDLVPRLEQDHIPHRQCRGGQTLLFPASDYQRHGGGQVPQLLQGLVGVVLLGDGQHPVHRHNDQDDGPVQPVPAPAGRQRQPRRRKQHQYHGVLQLPQQPQQQGRTPGRGKLVGPVPLQPPGGLPVREPLRSAVQLLHHLMRRHAVPPLHVSTLLPFVAHSIPPGLSCFLQNPDRGAKKRRPPETAAAANMQLS